MSTLLNERALVIAIVALAAFLFAGGILVMVSGMLDPARRRLAVLESAGAHRDRPWTAVIADAVQPLARYLMPTSGAERGSMQDKFVRAGIRSARALPVFYGIKAALALSCLVGWLFASTLLPRLTSNQVIFYGTLAAFIGMTIPNFLLNRKVERRQRAIRNAFPDALDLLVVCVESGLGLAAGLHRVATELEVSHPELAGELERVTAEMHAGMEREAALRNLATRTGLEDIRSLVGLLIQTMRFGTSVADALRVYSEEFRDRRTQAAEELAAKLGTKMIFPMVLCFFPSFFLVAVGPAVIRLVQAFSNGAAH